MPFAEGIRDFNLMGSILNLIWGPRCQNFEKCYFRDGCVFEMFVVYAEIELEMPRIEII